MDKRFRSLSLLCWLWVATVAALAAVPVLASATSVGPEPETADTASVIEIRQLEPGVWLHTSHYTYPSGSRFPANGLIVREGQALTLVDTAWGELQTLELLAAIKEQIDLPVTTAVVTHAHGDRVAGVDVLESNGVRVLAHPMTQRLTMAAGLPVPNETLDMLAEPGSSTQLGGLEVFYPGPAHAMDNLMVWLPGSKILFGGCAIRALSSRSAGNTADGDVESWQRVIATVAKRYASAKWVVPGHGQPGAAELFGHTASLVAKAIEAASQSAASVSVDR